MSNTIFDIEQKQDSEEKLQAVQNIESKYILFADEFNDVARKAVESALENVQIDFYWGNKEGEVVIDRNHIKRIHLLCMNFRAKWILENTDEVWLLIDRYRSSRKVRTPSFGIEKLRESGFKHAMFPDELNAQRPSEIQITHKRMILDFGQELYFHKVTEETPLKPRGGVVKTNNKNNAFCYLRFRIKVRKGDKTYYSKSKGTIKMILNRNSNGVTLNYKLT